MAYESRKTTAALDSRYLQLENRITQIVGQVQGWMNDATALDIASPTPAEKAEVVALETTLVAQLRTALGV